MADNEKSLLAGYSQFLDTSGEHLTYAALSTYRNFTGELSQKEKAFFQRHLEACPACFARLHEIAAVEEAAAPVQIATIFPMAPSLFRYAIAAVLLITIGITAVYILQGPRQDTFSSEQITPDQPLAEVIPDPARFVPNRTLENFIGRNVRSALTIALVTPAIGDTVVMPVSIGWKGNAGNEVAVTLVDNKNVEVWKGSSVLSEVTCDKKLEPGLYYLKLQSAGSLVQVGKFVVAK